jgi:hypothetical protein
VEFQTPPKKQKLTSSTHIEIKYGYKVSKTDVTYGSKKCDVLSSKLVTCLCSAQRVRYVEACVKLAQLWAVRPATLAIWTSFLALVAPNGIGESRSCRRRTPASRLNAIVSRLCLNRPSATTSARRHPSPRARPKPNPKSTARPSGAAYGKHGHRPVPPEADIDENLEAPLPEHCPHCGGNIAEDDEVDFQFQEEIPIKPLRRRFRIHKGSCRRCGRRVRGRHPLQTSDAVGAAASQVGPDARATITYLNKHIGLSYGKINDLFERTYGIRLTRSACAQTVLRAGRRLRPVYEEIRQHIHGAE